jgi:pilus assembly protein CpaB
MSRPASALNAGQTNKKFIYMALGLGLQGAVLVYAAFSRSRGSDGGATGDKVPVVVAKQDIEARAKITASMVEVKLISSDLASALGYTDTSAVVGQVTRFPISANEQVLSNKIVDLSAGPSSVAGKSLSYVIPAGKRAMAVTVKDVTNAGGLVLPGDYVDIIVVYDIDFGNDPTSPSSHEKADSFFIQTLYQNIEVLAVSTTIVDVVPQSTSSANGSNPDSGQRARNTEAKPDPEAKTVTLALTPEQAQKLYLAESNGRIRLAVRPFGDNEEKPIDTMIETDLFPRNLPNPFIR